MVGRIEAGRLRVGDTVRIAPTGQIATVASLEAWNSTARLSASSGQSVAVSFAEDVLLNRGQILSATDAVPQQAELIGLRAFWLDTEPLRPGDRLNLRLGPAEYSVRVERIDRVVDIEDLSDREGAEVGAGGIAELVVRAAAPIPFDPHGTIAPTGRVALARGPRIVGGGLVLGVAAMEARDAASGPVTAVPSSVAPGERVARNGHRGGVVWLTGLSGAGKSTLAMGAQRRLFEQGWQVTVLDGDNLRHGLNRDLGFSPEDRLENVRRVAETARLFAEAGMLVIVSLISPTVAMREAARAIIGDGFREVWVKADLETCAARDPKGLYAAARAGRIKGFTGVSAPFEAPAAPELVLDTVRLDPRAATERLIHLVERDFCETAGRAARA